MFQGKGGIFLRLGQDNQKSPPGGSKETCSVSSRISQHVKTANKNAKLKKQKQFEHPLQVISIYCNTPGSQQEDQLAREKNLWLC
jgi:hypothetical protein